MKNCFNHGMNNFEINFHDLLRLHRARFIHMISDSELFPGQIPLLSMINRSNGCTQKEIGNFLRFKPASITDSLKRMEKANLITRKQDEKDLRISRVYITDLGRDQLKKAVETSHQLEAICFAGFTTEEKELFISYLKRIKDNLKVKGDE